MGCGLVLGNTAALFALSWSDVPSFDGQAALFVGAIVVLAVAVVIAVAVATPFIALQAGATFLGTALAITGIALVSGLIGGTAAGVYWGRQADLKREEQIQSIMRVSNQLDIYFEPSAGDARRAADFECTLVVYEETDLASRQPSVTTRRFRVTATSSEEFYGQVDDQMKRWFGKRVEGDKDGHPRRVMIFMRPYPGEGIYERLKQIAEQNGSGGCVVHRTEGGWVSSLPR
jgi:hypothetical protein